MLTILEKSDPEVEKLAAIAGQKALAQQQIVLVGWSGQQGRMVGWRYERQCMEDGFTETPLTNFVAAPWDDSWPKPWRPNSVEVMTDMLRFQVRRLREADASYAAGDKFTIAILTPETILFEKVAEAHGAQSNLAGAAA